MCTQVKRVALDALDKNVAISNYVNFSFGLKFFKINYLWNKRENCQGTLYFIPKYYPLFLSSPYTGKKNQKYLHGNDIEYPQHYHQARVTKIKSIPGFHFSK